MLKAITRLLNRGPNAEVLCTAGPHFGARAMFRSGQVSIGRDRRNHLVLDVPHVSHRHARVLFLNGMFVLEDCGSVNGVHVNGQRVSSAPIAPNTPFQIGGDTFIIRWFDGPTQSETANGAAPRAQAAVRAPVLLRDYDLRERLSGGEQTTVWRGMPRRGGQAVAIKFANEHAVATNAERIRANFEQQLRIGLTIQHPHCGQVLGGDAMANPPYLIESLLTGGTLAERLHRERRLAPDVVTRIIGQIGDAASYLHRRGLVHQEICPDNILFDAEGTAYLVDFGRVSTVGMFASRGSGRARYQSPEQIAGARLAPHMDVYSLTVVAYEALTGRPPFEGTDEQVMEQHRKSRPTPLRQIEPSIPVMYERAVLLGLEKKPSRRFRNMREFVKALGYTEPFHTSA